MKTKKLTANDIGIAVEILKGGGLVAIPTETVYGLAANALDSKAVKKIFAAKGRPSDNPLIVHISMFDEIYNLVSSVPMTAKKLADVFWPGPLTIIVPKSDIIPGSVSAGLESVAIRMPCHKVAREIIRQCKLPLAAPSANLSGTPSPTKFSHVLKDFDGVIDAAVDGGDCMIGIESTVINLCLKTPRILRPGQITKEEIEKVIGFTEIDESVVKECKTNAKVSCPGMKYRHYSPKANVIMVVGPSHKFVDYVNSRASKNVAALCFDDEKSDLKVPCIAYGRESDYKTQAFCLFDSLREFDLNEVTTVFAHFGQLESQNLALYNRLIRASGFNVITL